VDNTVAFRFDFGLITSLGNGPDLKIGMAYSTQASFNNQLGSSGETSLTFLQRYRP
jgi:hypothetical protein